MRVTNPNQDTDPASPGSSPETLSGLLGLADPISPAIGAVDGRLLRYDEVVETVDRLAGQLAALGIQPNDRVAIALPNGPEAALVTLAVAACSTAAPLNPGYKPAQFRFYLGDLGARIAITGADGPSLAASALDDMLSVDVAGPLHDLRLEAAGLQIAPEAPSLSGPGDVALVLHTSGTTARPKQVPLTHRNLANSATNVARTLELNGEERSLNVMPLFHIHGLVAGLFAPLAAGAAVTCSPGFDPFRFHRWLDDSEATWFSAVPTMYQILLARADQRGSFRPGSLRLVRSSSAPMPPELLEAAEELFKAPFIEAYGMTEASHQMTSNPLPPGDRKPGSVGVDGMTEVRVLAEDGSWAVPGQPGEAVIRGKCVTSGYVGDATANESSFVNGWLRTGDLGHFDEDGYLFITGRLKEIINRGGTKISPREIDEVLLQHPDVAQAVAFAVPHRWLGETVGAAVVLQDGSDATVGDIRGFAASMLVDSRVPDEIVIVPEVPTGPSGKLQRVGLAEALGLT